MHLINEVDAYNQRQLRAIQRLLLNYRQGKISLVNLDVDLKGFAGCLQNSDRIWQENFMRLCSELTGPSYLMVYDERPDEFSSENEKKLVEQVINTLINMVQPLILPEEDEY